MSSVRLLLIQPGPDDPPGPLGEWLTEAGADIDLRHPPRDELPDTLDGYDALVVLGGGMDCDDDAGHPWLPAVRLLLGSAVTRGLPTLGVCLGSQLLAASVGGRVGRGADGPEVGGCLVSKKDAAWIDPLFADLPLMQDVVQFHRDVITQLPAGAELLASSPIYPNQAFRVGRCAYGVQFHIETTPDILRLWAAESPEMTEFAPPDAFSEEKLTTLHTDVADIWRPFAARFVQLAAGELAPAGSPTRSLPMA
ncbi:glutamine amidotransferase [Amycolatopsis antarctica]|uniref:Glutamine amidotransferase n=1 Tax=Amycolatopsis antarctica TaxID=1854586 RepID=A0A263CUW4_9PSEU|nr:type 1 glutamine amidotransferase [Amycolatopsis antarctica]OZM69923.1 glutamine amidotransferase [Amycolatopsis antarctica]